MATQAVHRVGLVGEIDMAIMSANAQRGALDGIRVLDLSRFQAGPRCAMQLSDMGADVIKIEPLGGELNRKKPPHINGQSLYFAVYNRGKRSICLDLRSQEGKDVLLKLVETADIVLENFRPGTLEKMGLGYDVLEKVRPGVILIRVSAFGQYGPYHELPGIDPIGQAMTGLMTLTGRQEGKPIQTAFSLIDRTTALNAAIGALAALFHRDRTGEGQVIDVSLLDAGLTMVEIPISTYVSTGEETEEGFRGSYRAKDGWVIVQCVTHESQKKALELVGQAAVFEEAKLQSTVPLDALSARKHPVQDALTPWCAERTVAEICEQMGKVDAVVAPVLTIPQAAKDPHLWEREMLVKSTGPLGKEMYLPGFSVKFSKTPGKLGPVPAPGEHTDEILKQDIGYSDEAVARLRQNGVVG